LQKLRDVLKGTRRTRAGNRSDHFNRRKRKFENLFPASATTRFLGADTVAGAIPTSNEFLKNFGPITKKGRQTKQAKKART